MKVRAISATIAALPVLLLVPLFTVSVQVAYAQGDTAADAQCIPTIPVCGCGMIMGQQGCMPGANKYLCPCSQSDNGFTTSGICQASGKCLAQSTGGKAPDSGLSQLASQLGQLLGQLMKGSGGGSGSGSGSAPAPAVSATCPSFTPTSDPTQIGVNPCVYYVPSAASSLTGTTGTTSDTSAQDLLNSLTGSSGSSLSAIGATGDTLAVTPQSGPAPLTVTFTTSPIDSTHTYTVDPGDGSGAQALSGNGCSSASSATCVYGMNYTYNSAGTYTATLSDENGDTLATISVSVLNPGGPTSQSSTAPSGLTQGLSNIGNFLSGQPSTSAPSQGATQSSSNFPGVFGNILLDQNGATIFASTVNSASNSETSGFYGSDTLGGQPQGIAGDLCQGRPWASNALADIIPPSFFDSLCQWGGYQVGQSQQPAPAQTQPQVTLTQQIQTQPSISQSAPAATTTTPAVPPQVVIWAVPSTVPLGARTSIFWNTQGVSQCAETSPDGSFSESSLSGAAATVPITGATTFSISCVDPNGNPVTDFVTVQISS